MSESRSPVDVVEAITEIMNAGSDAKEGLKEMVREILKFRLGAYVGSSIEVFIPHGTEIVKFGIQETDFYIWCLSPQVASVYRSFIIKPTGWNVEPHERHIETIQADDGCVWHLFEIIGKGKLG